MTLTSSVLAWLLVRLLLLFAHAWTGVRPLWRGPLPGFNQRVYFANHGSHGDFLMIWASLPVHARRLTRPVAGQDYWLASRIRRFAAARVFRALLIDRHAQAGAPPPVTQMVDALALGDSLILFPEGTRNTTDAPLLPFRSGLYHLSRHSPTVEFVPVWIDNIRRVIPKGEVIPVPMTCSVSFGEPLLLREDESRDDFLRRAEQAVMALRPVESLAC